MRARFILFVLMVALIPPLLTLVYTTDAATRTEHEIEAHITAASSALTDKLEAEEARRREILLRIVALPEVVSIVRSAAASDQVPPPEAVARVRAAVSELFRDQAPELIAVVNQAGAQVVVTNGEPKATDVESLAPASAALAGQMAVTYSKFENKFYRLTSAPVGISDGAIVLGDSIGPSTVGRLREAIGADVTFALAGKPVVSSIKDQNVRQQITDASRKAGTAYTGELSLSLPFPGAQVLRSVFPIGIPHPGLTSLARTLSPVARDQGAAPRDPASAVAIVSLPNPLGWTGRAQVMSVVAALAIILMGLIWIQALYGPVYRQARSIESHIARLRVERSLRLTARGFTSPFTAIALMLDKLADDWTKDAPAMPPVMREPPAPQTTETPRPIQRPPVELPLASPPPPPASAEVAAVAAAFPFQDDPHAVTGRQKISPVNGATGQEAPTSPAGTPAPAALKAPVAPPPAAVKTATPPPAAPPPTPKPEPRVDVKPTPSAIRIEPKAPSPVIAGPDRETSGPIPLPGSAPPPLRNGTAKPSAPKAASSASISDSDIPPDLLARSSELERELMGGGSAEHEHVDEEDAHYHSVFDEFLATRRRCGEANEGLTYDKFTSRLKKNRDQLIEKYHCRTVRFQVYVKDGKAAVKAVPVR